MPSKKTGNDVSDFDPSELLASREVHEKTIASLGDRMAAIEGCLSTPQSLATFFRESAKDSRTLEGVFAEMFCRFIKENEGVKQAIETKINEADRSFLRKGLKRSWGLLWTAFIFLAGGVAKQVLEWLGSLLPHH